eukprot:CAMPEP_0184401534 /NCGR_PEP_ID=MMETSP0007-20130409/79345_1 /TAXON_ID=97485 /ORGANISM="Prymnesium parvum, Strain Texoma1" /LENGTH=83 /DNA_ID=CAMNT_0026756965 /DNA_START=185 /DNA_END=436 /DNA_ORIENTATION=+
MSSDDKGRMADVLLVTLMPQIHAIIFRILNHIIEELDGLELVVELRIRQLHPRGLLRPQRDLVYNGFREHRYVRGHEGMRVSL